MVAPVGTYGNMGLGILRQPAWNNFDVTLSKKILLGKNERCVLRIRIEAYNFFNHTEFTAIGTQMQMLGTSRVNTTWDDTPRHSLPARFRPPCTWSPKKQGR